MVYPFNVWFSLQECVKGELSFKKKLMCIKLRLCLFLLFVFFKKNRAQCGEQVESTHQCYVLYQRFVNSLFFLTILLLSICFSFLCFQKVFFCLLFKTNMKRFCLMFALLHFHNFHVLFIIFCCFFIIWFTLAIGKLEVFRP